MTGFLQLPSRERLTMPIVFRAEGHALGVIKQHKLFAIGAQVERIAPPWNGAGATWRIVIYVEQPNVDGVVKYLLSRMPGVHWERSEAP